MADWRACLVGGPNDGELTETDAEYIVVLDNVNLVYEPNQMSPTATMPRRGLYVRDRRARPWQSPSSVIDYFWQGWDDGKP